MQQSTVPNACHAHPTKYAHKYKILIKLILDRELTFHFETLIELILWSSQTLGSKEIKFNKYVMQEILVFSSTSYGANTGVGKQKDMKTDSHINRLTRILNTVAVLIAAVVVLVIVDYFISILSVELKFLLIVSNDLNKMQNSSYCQSVRHSTIENLLSQLFYTVGDTLSNKVLTGSDYN
uniref:Uncharacterized protein n=1 Tax=Glossina pallidipes TaxID=7398 RepID=A0A1A9Z374_GLOPL